MSKRTIALLGLLASLPFLAGCSMGFPLVPPVHPIMLLERDGQTVPVEQAPAMPDRSPSRETAAPA